MMNKKVIILKKGKLQFCLFLIFICFFVFTFYTGLVTNFAYDFCLKRVNTESKNLVLLDYKVYGTENKFNEKALVFAESKVRELKNKGEFVVVKIKGDKSFEYAEDYVLIKEDTVYDLNVEIYIAKNVDIGNNSLPAVTVFGLMRDVLNIAAMITYAIIFLILLYKITRYAVIATFSPKERFFIEAEKKIHKTESW